LPSQPLLAKASLPSIIEKDEKRGKKILGRNYPRPKSGRGYGFLALFFSLTTDY
jgi:hypothetical protein